MASEVVTAVLRETEGMPSDEAFEYALGVIADLTPCRSAFAEWRERVHKITKSEAMVLEVLWKRRPHVVQREAIYEALYGGRYGDDSPNMPIVDVFIAKLRPKLPEGAEISTAWGHGYALTGYEVWEDQVADT